MLKRKARSPPYLGSKTAITSFLDRRVAGSLISLDISKVSGRYFPALHLCPRIRALHTHALPSSRRSPTKATFLKCLGQTAATVPSVSLFSTLALAQTDVWLGGAGNCANSPTFLPTRLERHPKHRADEAETAHMVRLDPTSSNCDCPRSFRSRSPSR